VFEAIWSLYFQGKIGKLAGHPYANFVVARGVERLEKEEIEEVVRECKAVSGGKVLISAYKSTHQSGTDGSVIDLSQKAHGRAFCRPWWSGQQFLVNAKWPSWVQVRS
jgi:hypothetical protein